MNDDIVTRLRAVPTKGNGMCCGSNSTVPNPYYNRCQEAADEIERWQDIARRLYLFIQDPCTHNHWCDVCSSIDAYEKAVNNG